MLKLKSKSLLVVAGLMIAGALVGAQASQSPVKIKKVKQQITFAQDVKVGSAVLKSGKYEVSSNDQGLSFRRMVQDPFYTGQWNYDADQKPVQVKAKATMLEAKSKGTRMDMPADSAGVLVLKSITLDDTNVTFTIEQ